MGLFDMFKKEPVIEMPVGAHTAGVYIYDDSKLPKKDVDSIIVEYVPGKQTLVSKRGNKTKTEGALSYKGKIFGCTFHPDAVSHLKKAAKHGKVTCTMVCGGINSQGYREWSLAFPSRKTMDDFLKKLDQ